MGRQYFTNFIGGLGVIAVMASCSPNPSPDTQDVGVQDTEAVSQTKPQTIVALTSIGADVVQTLAADTLVGIPGSPLLSNDPRFEGLTVVSSGRSEFQGYVTLSPEKVLEMNPDQLYFVDSGGGLEDEIAQLKTDPFWSQLNAVQSDQVQAFDYHGLINPGSIESIEQVCSNLGTT